MKVSMWEHLFECVWHTTIINIYTCTPVHKCRAVSRIFCSNPLAEFSHDTYGTDQTPALIPPKMSFG
jgi:hypothetical protein